MIENFLDSSSIHRFMYLSRRFHWIERIFWTISLIFSAICATFLIIELVIKMNNVPIVTYSPELPIKLTDIDHPAVTICSGLNSKVYNGSEVYVYSSAVHGMFEQHKYSQILYSDEFRKNLCIEDYKTVGPISYFDLLKKLEKYEVKVEDFNHRILQRLQFVDLVTRQGIFERLNLSVPTDNFMHRGNEFQKFSLSVYASLVFRYSGNWGIVSQIMTKHGFCFTFNLATHDAMYHTDLISADFYHEHFRIGTSKKDTRIVKEIMPQRIGNDKRLVIYPGTKQKIYNQLFNGIFDGHYGYIHSPYELPTMSIHSFPIHKKENLNVYVAPTLVDIDESLMDMKPTERNCYLENEKKLKFFKIYTMINCEHECLADYMISKCGCVEYFMIRNYTTRICSGNEKTCFDTARNEFENQFKNSCGCFLPCSYVRYDISYRPQNILPVKNIRYEDEKFLVSYNKIIIVNPNNNYLVRKKVFNVIDFLSFVGGLLGLFAGFSALSFIELIYWMLKKIRLVIKPRAHSIGPEVITVVPINQIETLESTYSGPNNLAIEYFSKSSIHGFNYLFNSGMFETIFWLFAVIFSISCCATLIAEINEKLPDSRIVAIDENIKSIGKIPFPAVTIELEKYVGNDFENLYYKRYNQGEYKKKIESDPEFKRRYIDYISKITTSTYGTIHFVEKIGIDPEDYLLKLLHNSSTIETFKKQFATFNGIYSVHFSKVQLYAAQAYTFNLMDADNLFYVEKIGLHQRYTNNITMMSTRSFPSVSKELYPLSMEMDDKVFELQISTGVPSKVAIHEITTYPNFLEPAQIMKLHQGYNVIAEVTPEITITDESLRKISPQVRECFFENEKKLKYFKTYTEGNCKTECLSVARYKACGCITTGDIFMNEPNNHYCHKRNETFCVFESKLSENYTKNCNCLSECRKIVYKIAYFAEYNLKNDGESTFTVRMKTENAILYRKSQQFTFSDQLSYVGGLLGLFAGISMLSFVEVIYFFVFRLIINFWRSVNRQN